MKPFGPAEIIRWATGTPTLAEIRAAAPLYPGPDGRDMTQLEAVVLGKMQATPNYVEEIPPPYHSEALFPTQHRLLVLAEGTGGAIMNATVYSHNERYGGMRLSGSPVAEQLGATYATLYSSPDGRAAGERVVMDPSEEVTGPIKVEGGWRRLVPWRFSAIGRIGLLFWNGKALLPPVQEPQQ